ncbi:MAG TPA: FG-GAP-like repeat-containing protein, partial [Candidatus Limnocylindrales bacterium]|nr:FG-GAP-like repeat-containing protein [Candidatus Limnocylindrales bacterium]
MSIVIALFARQGSAQQPSITYVYDDLGRLVRVITAGGDAATYHYDAVGNILRITRETGVAATASVISVSSTAGVRGTSLLLTITGLNLAGANLGSSVGDIAFTNIRTSLDQITTDMSVTPSAPIGVAQIFVETQFGTIPIAFTITDSAPAVAIVTPAEGSSTIENGQVTLTAQAADNVQVTQVSWTLNGVPGPVVTSAPYQAIITTPINITSLNIQATATDSVGQTTSASRAITVLADPPPMVVITSPLAGATVLEGSQLNLSANATDNVQVAQFVWTVNGVEQNPIFSSPYEKIVNVPLGITSLTILGKAIDNLGRSTTATRTVTVLATPKTTVIGRVVSNLGQTIAGASVSVFVQYTALSQNDGSFTISNVPTNQGNISATAQAIIGGSTRTGVSASVPPVVGATTNVGDIVIAGSAIADLYPAPIIGIDAAAYLAVTDLNGDGILDIVAPNISTSDVWVFLGTGAGTFQTEQRFPAGNSPWAIAAADLNGDGILDLVTTNTSTDDVSVLIGNGNGTFQSQQRFPVGDFPYSVALSDLNGDGRRDIIVANQNSNDVSVLLGNGNGTFQPQQRYSVGLTPYWIAVADLNRDGFPDIVTPNANSNNISVLIGNGNGTFQAQLNFPTGSSPSSVNVADLNGDGLQDIAVANNFSDDVSVLLGNGDGTFQIQQRFFVGGGPVGVTIADLNGDGVRDLVTANQGDVVLSALLGSGNGTFQNAQSIPVGRAPQFVALADVNGDGFQDLVTSMPFTDQILLSFGNGD